MAAARYDEALRRLLMHEGGYSNHPSDPGGPTKFGITIHDVRRYVKPGATASDVEAMSIDEARRIYRAKYWDALRCDELPDGVDYAVFDYGVNSGTGRAARVLQRVCSVADDGVLGPESMRAVAHRDPCQLVTAICDERMRFLRGLRTWPVFGKGWSRRVADVRTTGGAWAAGAAARSTPVQPAQGRAITQQQGGLTAVLLATLKFWRKQPG